MRAVIQRVTKADVKIEGETVGKIDNGLMILLGVQKGDTDKDTEELVKKTANLRIFCDENDKMNLSILDIGGSILAISQFTLLGDARHGRRPSFTDAEKPDIANNKYMDACKQWRNMGIEVQTGEFGADMAVSLINDGPVTILLDTNRIF